STPSAPLLSVTVIVPPTRSTETLCAAPTYIAVSPVPPPPDNTSSPAPPISISSAAPPISSALPSPPNNVPAPPPPDNKSSPAPPSKKSSPPRPLATSSPGPPTKTSWALVPFQLSPTLPVGVEKSVSILPLPSVNVTDTRKLAPGKPPTPPMPSVGAKVDSVAPSISAQDMPLSDDT